MTVRQIYYQLVSRQIIENRDTEYNKLKRLLTFARKQGIIPWGWVEDRLRRPQVVSMWADLPEFMETVKRLYRQDIWLAQRQYVEVWLEKDALSGIFNEMTESHRITLVVMRGFTSWTALSEAVQRFENIGRPVKILAFTDFDPSGEDIVRALKEGLSFFEPKGRNQH